MAGAILCDEARMTEIYDPWLRHMGPAASPFNAWVVLKGLETLKLRVEEQSEVRGARPDRRRVASVLAT